MQTKDELIAENRQLRRERRRLRVERLLLLAEAILMGRMTFTEAYRILAKR